MRVKSLIAALVLISASTARAEYVLFDSEPNNNFAQAQGLVSDIPVVNARFASCNAASEIGIGTLAAGGGDVDYYTVSVPAGCFLTAITTPVAAPFSAPDTVLAIYDNLGNELVFNDDGGTNNPGTNRGSAVRLLTTYTGVYYVAVSGYGDGVLAFPPPLDGLDDFTGAPHTETGVYGLTLSVFPEPSTLALLGMGVLALARRRK